MTFHKADQGCAIVMEVETGYIKALANLKRNKETGEYEESYNFALGEKIEPGSTFKLPSMIVLLENNKDMNINSHINIGRGPLVFSRKKMFDDHVICRRTRHHPRSFRAVLQQRHGTADLQRFQRSSGTLYRRALRLGAEHAIGNRHRR